MLYPLTFQSIFKQRLWGGRNLERLFGKALPAGEMIGESWEISDRPEDISVVANGPLAGRDLHWVADNYTEELYGPGAKTFDRFPLLVKILDAREQLSLQVHPPPGVAARLGGEPKTEMWYVAHAEPNAEIFVGLREGTTRADFERKLGEGTVAECFHRNRVQPGDVMFLPSGRVHGIGAGLVIFEIQQNSDTTYRVFDWNRVAPEGKPRTLHVPESLASINFEDFEPPLNQSKYSRNATIKLRFILDDPLFRVDGYQVKRGERYHIRIPTLQIICLIRGRLLVSYKEHHLQLKGGQFVLLPASVDRVTLTAETAVEYLQVQPGVR